MLVYISSDITRLFIKILLHPVSISALILILIPTLFKHLVKSSATIVVNLGVSLRMVELFITLILTDGIRFGLFLPR